MNNGYQNSNMPNHKLTAEGWEWTPEGKHLLAEFKAEIHRNGGRLRLLSKVSREKNRRNYKFVVTEVPVSENSIIFLNWDKMTAANIAKLVGKTRAYVWGRAKFLGLPNKQRDGWKTDFVHNGKMVTNGYLTFNTIKEAAEYLRMKPKTLSAMLTGQNVNKTNFKLI